MKKQVSMIGLIVTTFLSWAVAQELQDVSLPAPRMEGGKPLMQALKERHSTREFGDKSLPEQVLADLLWAAFGINRPDSGRRTAPSALNWQEIDVYAVTADGVYLYDAKGNTLKAVASGDLRKLTGLQEFVAKAPLNLVYVSDTTRVSKVPPDKVDFFSGMDAAFIAENVYLFCASEGLVTVVRGSMDAEAFSKALNLPSHCKPILAQSIGYPVESP